MKINWSVNEDRRPFKPEDKVKTGEVVYLTQRIYNNPLKGREAKKLLFDIGNVKVVETTSVGFKIENKMGTIVNTYYSDNIKGGLFYKYVKNTANENKI